MRVFLTLTLMFVGITWLTVTNGQHFTNRVACIFCMGIGVFISVRSVFQTSSPVRRAAWSLTALILFLIATAIATELPESYERQQGFNAIRRNIGK